MWLFRRVLSLNWLYAVLALIYPPLRYIPLGALAATVLLVGGLWMLSQYVVGHAPKSLSIRTLPAVLIRKPKPGPGRIPLDFPLIERDGSERLAGSTLGKGKTVMYLYSPYCGHCQKLLPGFAGLARRLDSMRSPVVGVQFMGNPSMVAAATEAPGRLLADPGGKFCGAVGVGEFTVFVLDAEGTILHRSAGDDLDTIAEKAAD